MPQTVLGSPQSGATLSPSREYRFSLWRRWDRTKPFANFVMLNPSTADEVSNDPTIRRCTSFAKTWGFGGMEVTNIFALRSTDPAALYTHRAPIGGENDAAIRRASASAGITVAAWGVHGRIHNRGPEVLKMLSRTAPVHCLGVTKAGHPKHPLYLPRETTPVLFAATE